MISTNNNKINNIENKNLSFNDKKTLVEDFLKVKRAKIESFVILEKEKEEKKEVKENEIKNNDAFGFDLVDDIEIDTIKKLEAQEDELEDNDINLDITSSKSDNNLSEEKINLWKIIPISNSIKKIAQKGIMKSLISSITYNGKAFKDKLSESSSKKIIIIYNEVENNFTPQLMEKIRNSFIYMSYRTGLINTNFLCGGQNNYSSDCGWGCMLRCCQMMLSRGFMKYKLYEFKQLHPNSEINLNEIRKKIILLFYDKFIKTEDLGTNEEIFEMYRKLLRDKVEVAEMISPYSIYVLTLIGQCPNVFTSDHRMISSFLKINKVLFNNYIKMIHLRDGSVNKQKLLKTFCQKIEINDENKEDYIEYNSEKYKFVKGGLIFISLRLGLQNIESSYIPMIPKLFINLHNNIGFVSGKKKRAFYFIGICGDKLIFADPHFNQNIDEDEINLPSYSVSDLFLMSIKELSGEITVGISIFNKEELEQFFKDMEWFKQICPGLIIYKE